MGKNLHAVEFDGTTFGMELDTDTPAWRKLKAAVKVEKYISKLGFEGRRLTVPHIALAACMREAHWLVSERKAFDYITIDGFMDDATIYVKYRDGILDLCNRK